VLILFIVILFDKTRRIKVDFLFFLVVDFEQESNLEKQNLNTQLKIWMYKRLRLIVVLCWEEKDSS
jgi:hypothetical protein